MTNGNATAGGGPPDPSRDLTAWRWPLQRSDAGRAGPGRGPHYVSLPPRQGARPVKVRWCPGCGDYAILAAVQGFMPELGVARENIVFVSGIGCSSRFPYYMNTYGMNSIHGRAPAIATGLAISRRDLSVWTNSTPRSNRTARATAPHSLPAATPGPSSADCGEDSERAPAAHRAQRGALHCTAPALAPVPAAEAALSPPFQGRESLPLGPQRVESHESREAGRE